MEDIGNGGQRVHTSSYKMNKFWRSNVQHGDYSYQYHTAHLTVARRVDLKSAYHTWEDKLVQPLWRTVWRFLKKLKM